MEYYHIFIYLCLFIICRATFVTNTSSQLTKTINHLPLPFRRMGNICISRDRKWYKSNKRGKHVIVYLGLAIPLALILVRIHSILEFCSTIVCMFFRLFSVHIGFVVECWVLYYFACHTLEKCAYLRVSRQSAKG